jgi:hypothetical protein
MLHGMEERAKRDAARSGMYYLLKLKQVAEGAGQKVGPNS